MKRHAMRWARAVLALALLGAGAARGAAQTAPADTVTLSDLLARVEARSPRLAAMRAGAEAAALRRPSASTLPDPVVQLGVMNVGLPSLRADMPSSMAPSVQLMQMVPLPGKLSLMGRIAELDEAMAAASADEMSWEMREMAAGMFYDLWAEDRQIEVMNETLALLRDFQQVARALYASGMGRQADVLRAQVEVARMEGEVRSMEAMRRAMAAKLNALLGLPADAPLGRPVLGILPASVPSADTLLAWASAARPLLAQGRQAVEQARSRVALARKELWPDLTLGVAYGQRGSEMGTERMGSAMVGFSLPVFAGRRQHAMRDEASAMERMASAELAGREAEVSARIAGLLDELARTRALGRLYREEILPQARAAVASSLSAYRVGGVEFMTLVDAQMGVNGFQQELDRLTADHGKALASLEAAVGRALPPTAETLTASR
ncbi:MAG: TolC family protein [Gemmatimonadetes bacterium]|nr:TolC family protein [Gemmatimonadota bacterium]